MLSLTSFHLFFIALSIVLTAALGVWSVMRSYLFLGVVSLGVSGLLVVYEAYFAAKAERIDLK